jgi:DNA-binding CsgD family transcriptional regulator
VLQALVGRDDELAVVDAELARARGGAGRVVLLAGEPGIGKSSLAAVAAERATAAGVPVAWGRVTEHSGAPPFWPWRQVVTALGGADPFATPTGDDPETDRFLRFEAAAAWLAERSRPDGALVVLDDVHRADEPSLWLLAHIAAVVGHTRALVVATTRTTTADRAPGVDGPLDALARLPSVQRLDLGGLSRPAVATILGKDVPDDVVEVVVARSGGNPLFVGELGRHLAGGGALATVPASVREGVVARLQTRSSGTAEVLRTAAVVGRRFPAGLVATAVGRPVLTVLHDIDDSVAAGLVEPEPEPGWFRFVHVVVRDAIESSLGAAELPAAHRRVAAAIETYEGTGPSHLADLARHWDAASALGERDVAAGWAERAADAALRDLAWENAVRLYDRAVELDGAAGPEDRHRRLLGAARARLHCDQVGAAVERCVAAARVADAIGRADLVAEAALVVEGRGPDAASVLTLADAALAALGPAEPVLRARLLGQRAALMYFVDPRRTGTLSEEALAAATTTGDPQAMAAAARARQMACTGPDGTEERMELAARIGAAGRALGRPAVAMWEPIWRFDALVELGRLSDASTELGTLRTIAEHSGIPIARWHVARLDALLAQATGRFVDGVRSSERARDLLATLEDPRAAHAMHMGYLMQVATHVGPDDVPVAAWDDLRHGAPAFLGDLPLFGPALAMAWAGDHAGARAMYDRLAPVDTWSTPPHIHLQLLGLRVQLALLVGRLDDLAPLRARLAAWPGHHLGSGAGAVVYAGPVALWTGTAAAATGALDDAVADLEVARATSSANGARPWVVHAEVELADALALRGRADDTRRATALRIGAREGAVAMGMAPWIARIDAATDAAAGPLSPRELEVAGLLARGRTNKQVAAELHISERTAQNHVQHILTKLDLANRTQVATWFTTR